ncbi:hypothetical protein ACC806_03615 [Rhizobium ruizarguesonis]
MTEQGPADTRASTASKRARKLAAQSLEPLAGDDAQLSFFARLDEPTNILTERIAIDHVPSLDTVQVQGTLESSLDLDHLKLMDRFPALLPFQENRKGTARAGLVAMLNDCLIEGRIPRGNDPTKINRRHFSDALGVSLASVVQQVAVLDAYEAILEQVEPANTIYTRFGAKITSQAEALLSDDVMQVLAKCPQLHKHQFYPPDGNAGRLAALLNGQILSGNIERSRGGKLNRQWLTERLGLTKTAITPYNDIIVEYEEAIGGVEAVIETRIPEMRRWLDACIADGTLEVRDQKIARRQFYDQFEMPQNSTVLLRYPRIAALIEEYDELVRTTDYRPKDVAGKLTMLEALLADDDLELNKDGSLNRRILDDALDLPPGTTSRPPYLELLLRAEKRGRQTVEEDPYSSVQCGRIFKFGDLIGKGWPGTFVKRVTEGFARNYRTQKKSEAKVLYLALRDLLTYVSESTSSSCIAIKAGIAAGEPVKSLERHWTMATQEYRDHLGGRYENRRSANTKIRNTNKVLRDFGNEGVLPPLGLSLMGFREDNPTHLRSVAEVTVDSGKTATKPHVDQYLFFATSMLKKAAIAYEVEISTADQSDFNSVLRAELENYDYNPAENPASVILKILERRLRLLESAAIAIVDAGRTEWDYGQSLIAQGIDPGENWSKIINLGEINRFDRDQLFRKYFPRADHDKERGIANLLAVVVNRYESQYPGNVLAGRPEGQFFSKRALEYGGAKKLQSYISPSQSTVSAVNTLYLLNSGSNVSVGREMYFDCLEESEEPRHTKVTGYKSRAGGKPIFVTLEDKSPAIQAMRWLQDACGVGRIFAGDDASQLFIAKSPHGEGFKMIEEWTYRAEFKAMVASIPELADLPLTPNMLRPSILLKTVLESGGRNKLSLALGQHGQGVNAGYTDKYPTRLMRDADTRRFMTSFETVVIRRVDEVFSFLGISPEGFERRVAAVMKTGLGTMCADRHGRPGNDGEKCTSIDCWNDCPQLLVIARATDIAILQIWQHSLREVEGEWVRDRPERWEKVWLPWLAFVDAVEIKMRQPAFLAVWRDAAELALQYRSQPNFKPMRLF